MDQSSPTSFTQRGKNRSRKCTCPILNIFIRSGDNRHRSLKSFKIGPNFARFWSLKFFGKWPLEILDQHYKIQQRTNKHAKFHAGRLTHLGDIAIEITK